LTVSLFLVIGRLLVGADNDIAAADLLAALSLPLYVLFVLLAMVYVTYMHGFYGQTLGQRLFGLRVLTTHGEELGYLNAFFRFVTTCFAAGLLGLGILWIAVDPNKQGWHDKVARTVIVRAKF